MARNQNDLPTVTLTISTNPQIVRYLKTLIPLGVFGKNPAEAAAKLVEQHFTKTLEKEIEQEISRTARSLVRRSGSRQKKRV
jgi:hypothetical protein